MACVCLRVDQLDAHQLDKEIESIVHGSVDETIQQMPMKVSRVFERIRAELKLITNAIIWSHRYYRGASPGQTMMDISYKNYTNRKIASQFVLEKILPYLGQRVGSITGSIQWERIYRKIEAVFEALAIAHFLLFLRQGGYSSIVESLLSLRNWNNSLPSINTINYDTQNRELMWHAFRDALLLVHPFIFTIKSYWEKRRKMNQRHSSEHSEALECVLCDKPCVIPMIGSKCGHVACYTCIASRQSMRLCQLCDKQADGDNNNRMEFMFKRIDQVKIE